jgi:sodium/hydrogen antiporter
LLRHAFGQTIAMDNYLVLMLIIGVGPLGMAWMPSLTEKIKISYSIIYVAIGAALYSLMNTLPSPDPLSQSPYVVRITEMVVIISLMGTGLKIDQPFALRLWAVPFRLVTITMMLSIGVVTVLAYWLLKLDIASALLLGAVLAPTDPVLASDVQVGPPLEKQKDNTRFSLTAEAGMNDGMAFPFTHLALAVALYYRTGQIDIEEWFFVKLIYKVLAGIACGYGVGKGLAYVVFYLSEKKKFFETRDGFVAISATLITYSITELMHGYGFIAVFVAAISIRNYELHHQYHRKLHSFTDQIERILLAIVLILFGGGLVKGLLDDLSWTIVLFSIVCVLIIRPLTALTALPKSALHQKEKLAISFYGIKGIGSFYYLSFAGAQMYFGTMPVLWTVVSFVVLLSIIIHGTTASFVMQRLGDQFAVQEEDNKP